MSNTSILILLLVLLAASPVVPSATAQRPDPAVPAVDDSGESLEADDFLDTCQDSLLIQSFPMLRTLIDLISQLLDLLNQADQVLGGVNPDVPAIPTDPPSTIALPDTLPTTTDLPGGWGIGPIQSVQ